MRNEATEMTLLNFLAPASAALASLELLPKTSHRMSNTIENRTAATSHLNLFWVTS